MKTQGGKFKDRNVQWRRVERTVASEPNYSLCHCGPLADRCTGEEAPGTECGPIVYCLDPKWKAVLNFA